MVRYCKCLIRNFYLSMYLVTDEEPLCGNAVIKLITYLLTLTYLFVNWTAIIPCP